MTSAGGQQAVKAPGKKSHPSQLMKEKLKGMHNY